MSTVLSEIEQACFDIAATARAMLEGETSFIEGARAISRLLWTAELDQFDPDLLPFVGIQSETDNLPLGDFRALWNPDSLARLQPEIDRMEEWARRYGMSACERLVVRFGDTPV